MVHRIRKILFASDLTESSIEVFEQAVALASQVGASITILHVIEDYTATDKPSGIIHLVDKDIYEKIRKEAQENVKNVLIGKQKTIPVIQEALQKLCDETCTGHAETVNIDGIEVRYGISADIILEVAEICGCDVIAMGYKKKGSLLKALMGGSSSKKVIQEAKKPIYLIPILK